MLGWWPCIYGFPLLQQALCEDGTGLVTILYNCQSNSYRVGVEAVFSLFCPCRRTMTNHLYLEWNHAEYYAANIYCLWCSVIKERRYLYSLSQNWWDTCMVSLFNISQWKSVDVLMKAQKVATFPAEICSFVLCALWSLQHGEVCLWALIWSTHCYKL